MRWRPIGWRGNDRKAVLDLYYYRRIVDVCVQIIDLSKGPHFGCLEASSNAMTILNLMNFSFAGMDLSHTKIASAYLDMANFDGANLQHAQIRDSLMSRANLNCCDLQNAELDNVDFEITYPDLVGHADRVYCVAISADGRLIASGSKDKTIKVWDLESSTEVFTLAGHSSPVISVVFTPCGKCIVSGGEDRTIRIWNAIAGNEIRTLAGHSGCIYSLAVSPDGKLIISGSYDDTIKLWQIETGENTKTFVGQTNSVPLSVAISSDGKYVVADYSDKKNQNLERGNRRKHQNVSRPQLRNLLSSCKRGWGGIHRFRQ